MRNHFRAVLFVLCAVPIAAQAQDWPQWRGPNRDNHVVGFTAPKTWPKELKEKWKVKVGIGEASPALVGGKVYVFARQGGDEVTTCLDAADGKELWTDKYAAVKITNAAKGFPGPRSTLAVGEGKVCTLGVGGVVSCLDAATGKVVWRKDTETWPQFYTSTSPVIVDGMCVVFVGSLTAYDLASGEVKWKWSGAKAPYGSPVIMSVGDVKQVVTPAAGGNLVGVDLAKGKLLWKVDLGDTSYFSNYSTPLIEGDMVYFSIIGGKGGKGSIIALKIKKDGDAFKAEEVWKKTGATDKYHTPVYKDGMIFGAASGSRSFFCMDAKTGEKLWTDTKKHGDCGCILDTGKLLIALTSDKHLVVFEPSKEAYKEVANYQVSESETWAVPIIAGNRVFVKDKAGNLTLWTVE